MQTNLERDEWPPEDGSTQSSLHVKRFTAWY